jgi:hypothetical protein
MMRSTGLPFGPLSSGKSSSSRRIDGDRMRMAMRERGIELYSRLISAADPGE